MQLLYAATLLTSATLLFLVQPMFAKMVLPLLGGTPAVWNTCMVFYQAALLGGYVYAHLATRWLGPRRQAAVHLLLMGLPWLVLPIAVGSSVTPPAEGNPTLWLLLLLGTAVGLPFLVVSASAPMLQAWFADTGHPAAKDPYFLYAASNLGSMLALLGYPLAVEPWLPLGGQSRAWAAGYGLLTALTAGCAVVLWRSARAAAQGADADDAASASQRGPGWGRRLRWLALALVPSALLLAVTTHISTDIAAVPLLWVVPLALYLLSFVLVFARRPLLRHRWMLRVQPFFVLVLGAWFFLTSSRIDWLILPLHLATFFVVAMVCHGELAATRPGTRHLTEFYLWMSVGGVVGGLFSAVAAPWMFAPLVRWSWMPAVLEYPLLIAAACLLRPTAGPARPTPLTWLIDLLAPAVLVMAMWWAVLLVERYSIEGVTVFRGGILLGVGATIALSFVNRPLRFALGVTAIMVIGQRLMPERGNIIYGERGFFGVVRVKHDEDRYCNTLVHGTINHGMQSCDPGRRKEPLTYYHRTGPLGQVIEAIQRQGRLRHIGAIGLGTGSIAAYGRPGQDITFYEIDPVVKRIAENPAYFTYLRDCKARLEVVLGDAYLTLAAAPRGAYDFLVLDAYSSDAIPIHLMTREALARYLDKLAPGGILALHISNRYFRLAPLAGRLAEDAGLVCRVQWDDALTTAQRNEGKSTSHWVVMARKPSDLGDLARDPWEEIEVPPGTPLWTNDFSDIIRVLKFR